MVSRKMFDGETAMPSELKSNFPPRSQNNDLYMHGKIYQNSITWKKSCYNIMTQFYQILIPIKQ